MSINPSLETIHARTERDTHGQQSAQQFTFRGPFFSSREAAAYIPCKSLKAFYEWCRRHGLLRRANGSIAKVDLDRELRRRRRRRPMAAASLANLRRRT